MNREGDFLAMSKFFASLKWIFYVSKKFSRVDRRGRSRVTSFLASLGICFGVMTLITVISVMNGFQHSFIDSIMEVSSYHIRVQADEETQFDFLNWCQNEKSVLCVTPFYEAQALMVGRNGRQAAALIRAVPEDILETDEGFKKEFILYNGSFSLNSSNSILLARELAGTLGVGRGGTVNLFALSGGNDVDLISDDREFVVTDYFRTGYAVINNSYAFINIKDGKKYFGESSPLYFGIKVEDPEREEQLIARIRKAFPNVKAESWRSYNRSFFGALRVEKNVLMLLVFLIFVVVAINIFNGMRRIVYERREEISVLSALGGRSSAIQSIFVMQGFLTGIKGAVPGLLLGLLISVRMPQVFEFLSSFLYQLEYFFAMLFNPQAADYIPFNSTFLIYSKIPPKIIFSEVVLITIFGIFSALFASWKASRGVLKMTVAEVLRDE